jgi:hypothetical protein
MRRLIVLLPAFLSACSTPYAERASRGDALVLGGTTLAPAGPEKYRIFAQGNAFTSSAEIRSHALRRAAKQASDTGFSGFYILETADRATDFVARFPAVELLVQLSNMPDAGYYRASDFYP